MKKILVVSDIYFETQYFLNKIPKAKEFEIASDVTNIIGSKTLNAARVLANLGNKVDLFGKVGSDGEKAIEGIKKFGIFTEDIEVRYSSKTGQIVVQTDSTGESAITLFFGANNEITPESFDTLAKRISHYDFVYAATNLPLESLYRLASICEHNEVQFLVDFPNQQKLVDLKRLSEVDFIAPNRQEAELLLDMKILSIDDAFAALVKLRKSCLGSIIITLDSEGAVLLEKDSPIPRHFPTSRVKVVDATASGDIFRAIFVSNYLKSRNINESIILSVKIATESVRLKGVDYTLSNLDYSSVE